MNNSICVMSLLIAAVYAAPVISADPQQDSNPQQNRDKYTLDIDTARQKIRGTQRWQDTHQTWGPLILEFKNFSYRQGFKPIAVLEYASVMVDTDNTASKDNKPFNATGKHHPDSRGASWCKFCDQKMKSVKAGSTKTEDIEDFFVLCGYPLASQIIGSNQSAYYQEFLKTVAKAKVQYTDKN